VADGKNRLKRQQADANSSKPSEIFARKQPVLSQNLAIPDTENCQQTRMNISFDWLFSADYFIS